MRTDTEQEVIISNIRQKDKLNKKPGQEGFPYKIPVQSEHVYIEKRGITLRPFAESSANISALPIVDARCQANKNTTP